MKRLFALMGQFILLLAGMALLTGLSLLITGAYLASWPIMRISPRNRRMQSIFGLLVALMGLARAYGFDPTNFATDDTEDTDTVREGGETDTHSLR